MVLGGSDNDSKRGINGWTLRKWYLSGGLSNYIDYENKIAEFLEKNKIFINLGDIKTNSKHGIRIKIDLFWNDNNKRKTFSENSKRFIDGKGLSRIIKNTDLC